MRKETEFYEVEERKIKLNIIIVVVSIVTLVLTGTFFASGASAETSNTTDIQTAEAYQAQAITE